MTAQLTIFAIPKPFVGASAVIQENALRSWARLPETRVILLGRDEGVAEAAHRYGAVYEGELDYSDQGTPLLNSAFATARQLARSQMVCYVNADILLFDDFLEALAQVRLQNALVVARRRNLDVEGQVEVENDLLRRQFLRRVRTEAVLEAPFGSDVFAFRRDIEWRLPAFAVGRPAWDNWLMFRSLEMKIPLVDVTHAAMVVHQNHTYDHVPDRRGTLWEGPEADVNRSLLGRPDQTASLLDATYILLNGRLKRPRGLAYERARILMWGKRSRLAAQFLRILRPAFRALKALILQARFKTRR